MENSTGVGDAMGEGMSTATASTGAVFALFRYDDQECTEKLWWAFLLSGLVFPASIFLVLGIWRLVVRLIHRKQPRGYQAVQTPPPNPRELSRNGSLYTANITRRDSIQAETAPSTSTVKQPVLVPVEPTGAHWSAAVQKAASEIVSAQSLTGKIAVVITFIVSMVSLVLYFLEVTNSHIRMIQEKCADWSYRIDWQLELICSVYLLVDFFIRFIAAHNKVRFMFEIYSIVDYLTIPPAFLVIVLDHHWTGLRFLRALYILSIPDILQFCNVLRTSTNIRLAQLLSFLTSVIFVSAGFFHLFETYGDFHLDDEQRVPVLRSYWEYVYFTVVSMSTVGYGDIYPVTRLGRAFGIVFILFAFAVFAAFVPEMFRLFQSRKRYSDPYKPGRGIRHVIAAGDITTESMQQFLHVFFCKQRGKLELQVVFVNRRDPDLEMEALLKRNTTRAFYIQGSVLDADDLERAALDKALACLILADKNAQNPTAEDAGSVMSVIAVKNRSPVTRCLVQLLQSRSISHVKNIPGFNAMFGDSVVCFSTLELGLLAQSCLAPGFATMIANLMNANCTIKDHENEVIADYVNGSRNKIFMEQLSDYFEGMSFLEATRDCLMKLEVLLIGILQADHNHPSGAVLLNPGVRIRSGHTGVFIAKSAEEVSRAWFICKQCHTDISRKEGITYCGCSLRRPTAFQMAARDPAERFRTFASMDGSDFPKDKTLPKGWERMVMKLIQKNPSSASLHRMSESSHTDLKTRQLESLIEEQDSDMAPLMAPISPSSDTSDESALDVTRAFYSCIGRPFKSAVMNRSKAAKQMFGDHIVVLVLAGPTDPPVGFLDFILPLRSSKIRYENLKEIVFLGDTQFMEKEWNKIRNLPKLTIVRGDPLDRADLRAVSIKTCAMCVILPSRSGGSSDPMLDDKDAILATLNIMAMNFERVEISPRSRSTSVVMQFQFKRLAREGFEVPTISALYQDVNVPLLEGFQSEKTNNYKEVMLMEPYVCGYALPLSALDSILIANFFNPYAIELIKSLLFGDMSMLTETLLAEGIGLVSGEIPSADPGRSGNSQLRLISLLDAPLHNRVAAGATYGTLFSEACALGMVCLGLGRRVFPATFGSKATKRSVITNPPPSYELRFDDLVYVLSS